MTYACHFWSYRTIYILHCYPDAQMEAADASHSHLCCSADVNNANNKQIIWRPWRHVHAQRWALILHMVLYEVHYIGQSTQLINLDSI